MRRAHFYLLVLLVLPLLLVGGCADKHRSNSRSYTTPGAAELQQTATARQLNAEAIEAMQHGEWDKAERLLQDALTADIGLGQAHNNLGKLYFDQGKYYLAAWEFQYASKLLPNQPEPRNNLGLVLEAVGRLDDALVHYTAAMQAEPDNAEFMANTARARVRRGDADNDLKDLLSRLLMRETRPEWAKWTREQIRRLEKAEAQAEEGA